MPCAAKRECDRKLRGWFPHGELGLTRADEND
jgi:hypothetical protein